MVLLRSCGLICWKDLHTEPCDPPEEVAGHDTGAQSALSPVDGAKQRPGTKQTPETRKTM